MAKIAVLGYGVVGSGSVEVFYKNRENLEKKAGEPLDIKYILDVRDFPDSPYADKFVKDFNVILNDTEVSVIAEDEKMISEKMQQAVAGSSAIRAMFQEGRAMAAKIGAENVFDFSLGNPMTPVPAEYNQAIIDASWLYG